MTNMLRNERGYFMDHVELYTLLGFKARGHLPDEAGVYVERGVTFVLKEKKVPEANRFANYYHRKPKSSKHRLFYECTCKRLIPFGRANQHKCKP